jgi:hypothetical protein
MRFPGRDDAAVLAAPGIDHCRYDAVHRADGDPPLFAVVFPCVDPFDYGAAKNLARPDEVDAAANDIDFVLFGIPLKVRFWNSLE